MPAGTRPSPGAPPAATAETTPAGPAGVAVQTASQAPGRAGRRGFLRVMGGAALAAVTLGAEAVLGASAAAAQTGSLCCLLIATETPWCPLLCAEQRGYSIRCWGCNGFRCKCCECTEWVNCFAAATCSYKVGCCYIDP